MYVALPCIHSRRPFCGVFLWDVHVHGEHANAVWARGDGYLPMLVDPGAEGGFLLNSENLNTIVERLGSPITNFLQAVPA
jgi:hypothetical protein